MADASESDFGELEFGEGFYSYLPIWLVESTATIRFVSFAFVEFTYTIVANVSIGFNVHSSDYVGPFWIMWIPGTPPEGAWIAESENEDVWVPDNLGTSVWVPDNLGTSVWVPDNLGTSVWVPVGPDMTPNEGP